MPLFHCEGGYRERREASLKLNYSPRLPCDLHSLH
jgi:hypothetical protein